jgi:CheY-like chemotaxis protein
MKRILLMDDSELSLELTGAALRAAGYEVVCAKDLEQLADARDRGG